MRSRGFVIACAFAEIHDFTISRFHNFTRLPFSVPQKAANLLNLFNHREAVCFSNVTQIAPITQILEPWAALGVISRIRELENLS